MLRRDSAQKRYCSWSMKSGRVCGRHLVTKPQRVHPNCSTSLLLLVSPTLRSLRGIKFVQLSEVRPAQPPWHLLSAVRALRPWLVWSVSGQRSKHLLTCMRELFVGVACLRSASVRYCPVLSCPALSWQISNGTVSLATALAVVNIAAKVVRFMSLWFYLNLCCLSGDCRYT